MENYNCRYTTGSTGFRRKIVLKSGLSIVALILVLISGCVIQKPVETGENIQPPLWAPYYDNVNMVRYYYFPDIECYYDVWNREFVYLEDGSWMFGATLPSWYSWFDLNTAFIVLLDYNVYEPWRHFHYYVSHYPRYYYRSIYRDTYNDIDRPMRGFNENERVAVYNYTDRRTIEEKRSQNIRTETQNEEIRRREGVEIEKTRPQPSERRVEPTRPSQRMEYYGKDIGRPVRVQPHMMKPHRDKK